VAGGDSNVKFIAGGTNLIDLMKIDVERPTAVIDITGLPLKQVESVPGGGLLIGALVRNTDLAYHPLVEQRYPVLASAIMAGAQQLRNMASTGGVTGRFGVRFWIACFQCLGVMPETSAWTFNLRFSLPLDI
jgi:CO/xanthine dehydrogenase FAD-binding subunit